MEKEQIDRRVDQAALKVNQAFIIFLLVAGFILDSWPLVAFVAVVMLLGTLAPPLSLFKAIYRYVLRPSGMLKPQVIPDNPEPHRFAQGLGSIFLAFSVVAHLAHQPLFGWVLAWLVIVLAALNLFLGFCAGCFIYYQMNRRGVPGFGRGPMTSGQ